MKYHIKKNFSKASNTYHVYDHVQRQSANILIEQVINYNRYFIPNVILDVGCGTGNVIHELYKKFPHARYHLNDISYSMLQETILQFHDIIDFQYIYGDIESCNIVDDYDLICSNLCLQWVYDIKNTIKKLCSRSKIFAFSYLLKGSFAEWYDLLRKYDICYISQHYHSVADIINMCSELQLDILSQYNANFRLSFDSPYKVMQYLKLLGANTPHNAKLNMSNLYKMLKLCDQSCDIEYNIGFFIVKGLL